MKLLSLPEIDLSTTAIIDYETYYDDECSITVQGYNGYVTHPMFDDYMVSVVNDDIQWVGHPKDFDWRSVDNYVLGAHNAAFDQFITDYRGYANYRDFVCTADMVSFYQCLRPLSSAVHSILKRKVDKAMRAVAKGKQWPHDFTEEERSKMLEYALNDSINSWDLLKWGIQRWPHHERKLSEITRRMGWGGVPVELSTLEEALEHLKQSLWETEQLIPWKDEIDPRTKKPFKLLSADAFRLFCAREGVKPPASLNKQDLNTQAWVAKYGEKIPWATAMQDYRSINSHMSKVQAMLDRVVAEKGASRMPYGLKYYGADTTGRWSGDTGFNTQNITKGSRFGVDLRALIRAGVGNTLGIVDLSNIEPRCLYHLAGDTEPLDLIRTGIDIYEAHARLTMGYSEELPLKRGDDDPEKAIWGKFRDLAKVRVLQLGYGSGWYKLYQSAHLYGQLHVFEDPYTSEDREEFLDFVKLYNPHLVSVVVKASAVELTHFINSFKQVMDFRAKSPKITGLWRKCQQDFEEAVGGDYEITLPSGRLMRYFNVRPSEDGLECQTKRGGPFLKFYGSKFVENMCQGTARDVFAEGLTRVVEEMGILPILQVHDELVIENKEEVVPALCQQIEQIFSETPAWLGNTPLASDSLISKVYTK